MATPSAVLSVAVSADTEKAIAQLSKFDRQIAATTDVARKGIETRLGGTFDSEAFTRYQEAVGKASRVAKDRAAFKAELGANFNNRGFQAYQRSVIDAEKQTKKLKDTQDKTRVSTEKSGSSAAGAALGFAKLGVAAAAVAVAYEAIGKARDAIESTLTLGEATERLTAATSLDTKQASTWIETAKARNISATQVTRGFATLDKQIRSASEGSKTSKKAFDELGVSHKALASGNTAKILGDVAQGLKNQKDPADRAALAQQLFGRAAQGLLPVFKEGKKGVDDALATTQKYGDYLSDKGAKSFKGALDAQRGLSQAANGIKISFTEAVLPTLVKVVGGLLDFIKQMRSGKGVGGDFANAIKIAFGYVKTAVGAVVTAIDFLIHHWPQIKAAAAPVLAWLVNAAQNTARFFVNAFNTLEPKVAAVFNAVKNAVAPVITAIINGFKSLGPTIGPFLSAFAGAVRTAFNVIKAIITPVVNVIIPMIVNAFQTAWAETKVVLNTIAGGVKAAFQVLKGIIEVFTGLFTLNFSKMWQGIKDIFSGALKDLIALVKGVAGLLVAAAKGLITQMGDAISGAWTLLKKAFGVGVHALVSIVTGIADDMFNAGKSIISSLGDGFSAAFNGVWGVIKGFINDIIDAIDLIPGVNIHHIGSSAPGAPAGSKAVSNLHAAGFATGGMVNRPGYFAGEEAPQHPEVILATNPAYRHRNLGLWAQAGNMLGVPGFALGGILGTAEHAITSVPSTIGSLASSAAQSITGLLSHLPAAPSLPSWIAGLPGEMLSKAAGFIKSKVTSLFSAQAPPGGGTGLGGPGGLSLFDGLPVASWIIPELVYAQKHGWNGVITSGYRPGFDPHAPSGSEHALTKYPGGAVDFGGMVDPAGMANKLAFMAASAGYTGLRLLPASGFRDDGHMSGTGHWRGGIHGRAVRALNRIPGFAQGGVNFQGKVSTFGPPGEAAGTTAYGRSSADAGISLRIPGTSFGDAANRALMGHLFDVSIGSHHAQLMDIDLGPADFTGRNIDVTGAGSSAMGINPRSFPTDAIGRVAEVVSNALSKAGSKAKGIPQKAKKHGTTAGFSFPGSPGALAGINFNRFKAGTVPAGTTPEITNLVRQINGVLDPDHGSAASLSDRISQTGQIDDQKVSEYQAANPYTDTSTGLIAFTDPVSGATTHSLDQTFVNMRIAELQQLLTWQTTLRDQLKATLDRITELVGRIQSAILTRRLYAHKVRDQIRQNIAQVNTLLVDEKAPKLTRKQKQALAGQVTALESQNKTLGGEKLKVGSSGVLGKVTGEINSLGTTLSTMSDNRLAIVGASGIGGTLGAANLDVQSFADQLSVFSPTATAKALATAAAADTAANAGGTGVAAPAGPDPALLQQLLDQAHLATSVAEHQLSVLSATPPFGGSFAQGGIVPGMPGEPRTIIAHGGEAVGTPGDTHVHVHLASGMEWLRQFIGVQVDQSTRRDARNASRPLPGRIPRL